MSRYYLSDGPLPFGKLAYVQADYREFACSRATFEWLAGGAMTHLDGLPVTLQVMDTLRGGWNVMVKAWPPSWAAETAFALESQLRLEQPVTA